MRHKRAGFKLNRDSEHRIALKRNMAIALFTHGQITTTVTKAKFLKPFVEKIITMAKKGDVAARRNVVRALGHDQIIMDFDKNDLDRRDLKQLKSDGYRYNLKYGELLDGPKIVKKIVEEIAPVYQDREGGYTRIIRLGEHRLGDGADLCVLQLVGESDFRPKPGGGPRREKANRRMEFAAKVRKGTAGQSDSATAVAEEEPAEDEPAPEVEAATEETAGEEKAGE